jgi:hypothetical protein
MPTPMISEYHEYQDLEALLKRLTFRGARSRRRHWRIVRATLAAYYRWYPPLTRC